MTFANKPAGKDVKEPNFPKVPEKTLSPSMVVKPANNPDGIDVKPDPTKVLKKHDHHMRLLYWKIIPPVLMSNCHKHRMFH